MFIPLVTILRVKCVDTCQYRHIMCAMTRVNIEQLMTPSEAAKFHGFTRQAIYRLISAGVLESVEISGRIFLRRADVEAYQSSNSGGRPRAKAASKGREQKST